jgi:hypothetical protein
MHVPHWQALPLNNLKENEYVMKLVVRDFKFKLAPASDSETRAVTRTNTGTSESFQVSHCF